MIFSPKHIKLIKKGQKTQTRRLSAGVYRIGRDYSVQPGRGKPGVPKLRIKITDIGLEVGRISARDAKAEGGYTPDEYEREFKRLYPNYELNSGRWMFEFSVLMDGAK